MDIGGNENYDSYPHNFKSNTLEKDISLYYSFKDNYDLKVVENELFSNNIYVQINTLGEDENVKFGNKYYTFLGMFLTDEYDRIDKINLKEEFSSHSFALIIHCKNIQTNSNLFITIPIKNTEDTYESNIYNVFYNTKNMTFDVNEFIPNKKFYTYSSSYKNEVSNFIIFEKSNLSINLKDINLNKKRNVLRQSIKNPLSISKNSPFRREYISSKINSDVITIECNPYEDSDEIKDIYVKYKNEESKKSMELLFNFFRFVIFIICFLIVLYLIDKVIYFIKNYKIR